MQVSKWLGHSSFVLTLNTYADYIPKDELAAPKLARLVATANRQRCGIRTKGELILGFWVVEEARQLQVTRHVAHGIHKIVGNVQI
jgi:hypothetical protein